MAYKELWLPTGKEFWSKTVQDCSVRDIYNQPWKLLQHTANLQTHSKDIEQEMLGCICVGSFWNISNIAIFIMYLKEHAVFSVE